MNKQKGVVLLITLFFISAISVLILKNLSDSKSFIEEVSLDNSLTQLKITDKNVKDEVKKFFNRYKSDEEAIEMILEISSLGIPFSYGGIDLNIVVEEEVLPLCYVPDINTTESLRENCEEISDNINYPYVFKDLRNKYKPKNEDQLEYMLNEYVKETKDDKILLVKDQFGFIKADENGSKRYLRCTYSFESTGLSSSSVFIFDLDNGKEFGNKYIIN